MYRNNKKKKDQKPLTSASDVLLSAKPEVSAAIQSGSDSSEENAPQESKKAPAEPAAHLSPQVAESKQGSSPGGPRSSEKPTRPATLATAQTLSAKVEAPRSAAKEQPSSSMSPEVKRLEFDSRSEEKSSDKKHSSAHKNASGAKDESKGQFSSPQRAPAEDPPNEIVESFRSARKAIENSADGADRSFRRDRSDSLDEVLKEHPHIVDPLTGDVSGNLVPSREVLQHHQRTASAKELVGLGTASPNLQKTYDNTSPKHNTAVALTNTAKALEGKLSMVLLKCIS